MIFKVFLGNSGSILKRYIFLVGLLFSSLLFSMDTPSRGNPWSFDTNIPPDNRKPHQLQQIGSWNVTPVVKGSPIMVAESDQKKDKYWVNTLKYEISTLKFLANGNLMLEFKGESRGVGCDYWLQRYECDGSKYRCISQNQCFGGGVKSLITRDGRYSLHIGLTRWYKADFCSGERIVTFVDPDNLDNLSYQDYQKKRDELCLATPESAVLVCDKYIVLGSYGDIAIRDFEGKQVCGEDWTILNISKKYVGFKSFRSLSFSPRLERLIVAGVLEPKADDGIKVLATSFLARALKKKLLNKNFYTIFSYECSKDVLIDEAQEISRRRIVITGTCTARGQDHIDVPYCIVVDYSQKDSKEYPILGKYNLLIDEDQHYRISKIKVLGHDKFALVFCDGNVRVYTYDKSYDQFYCESSSGIVNSLVASKCDISVAANKEHIIIGMNDKVTVYSLKELQLTQVCNTSSLAPPQKEDVQESGVGDSSQLPTIPAFLVNTSDPSSCPWKGRAAGAIAGGILGWCGGSIIAKKIPQATQRLGLPASAACGLGALYGATLGFTGASAFCNEKRSYGLSSGCAALCGETLGSLAYLWGASRLGKTPKPKTSYLVGAALAGACAMRSVVKSACHRYTYRPLI